MPKKRSNKRTFRTLLLLGSLLIVFVALIVFVNFRSTTIELILEEHPSEREAKRKDEDRNGYFALAQAWSLISPKLVPLYAHDPSKPKELGEHHIESNSLGELLDMARPDFHPHMLEYLAASEPVIAKVRLALEKPYWIKPNPSLVRSPYYENYRGGTRYQGIDTQSISKILLASGLAELIRFGNEARATELMTMSWEVLMRTHEFERNRFNPSWYVPYWYACVFNYASKGNKRQFTFLNDLVASLRYEFDSNILRDFIEVVDQTIWFPASPYYDKETANIGDAIEQAIYRNRFAKDVEFLRQHLSEIEGLFGRSYTEKKNWFADPKCDDFIPRDGTSAGSYRPFGYIIPALLDVPHYLETHRRVCLLAFDLEQFKRKNGNYPIELSEITFGSDSDHRNDAFYDAPFTYELRDSEFSLYRPGNQGIRGEERFFQFSF
jgi:hypothetical protein